MFSITLCPVLYVAYELVLVPALSHTTRTSGMNESPLVIKLLGYLIIFWRQTLLKLCLTKTFLKKIGRSIF
jgi:hypothetical protein